MRSDRDKNIEIVGNEVEDARERLTRVERKRKREKRERREKRIGFGKKFSSDITGDGPTGNDYDGSSVEDLPPPPPRVAQPISSNSSSDEALSDSGALIDDETSGLYFVSLIFQNLLIN